MKPADPMPAQPIQPSAGPSTRQGVMPGTRLSADTTLPTLADVVARIAAEVSGPLTAALARVRALAGSGSIDRPGLLALRDEIDSARRTGLRGQQIARFAGGRVQPGLERIDLGRLLRGVLTEQAMQANASAVGSRQTLGAAAVMGDPSLVRALLQAAADWSVDLAHSPVEWRLDILPWPVHARVQCRFAHCAPDLAPTDLPLLAAAGTPASRRLDRLDSIDWLLIQYTAHIAGVVVHRDDGPSHSTLVLEFINTVNDTLEGASAVALDDAGSTAPLMAGSQVLVLGARRDARQRVRAALHGHDLLIDYVPSVDAASHYCADGAPQVLVYEASFDGAPLSALCDRLDLLTPGVALIEIVPTGHGCEMGGPTGHRVSRVGAEGLRQMLASVMLLELARRR